MSAAASPVLSVVVVPFAGRAYLERCLRALAAQRGVSEAPEILVPHDETLEGAVALGAAAPGGVRFIALPGRCTPARLRAIGCAAARGAIVAITEDHCSPDATWCAEVLAAHALPYAAIGGAIEKHRPDGALGWAAYLCDYGRYMPPLPEGEAAYLTDCNVSYKRAALDAVRAVWRNEFHETTVHDALRARGERLWLAPALIVRQQRTPRLAEVVRERFDHGRIFARERVAVAPPARRLALAAGATLLPAVLMARTARRALRRRDVAGAFVSALPALALMQVAWSAGEIAGYLNGRREA